MLEEVSKGFKKWNNYCESKTTALSPLLKQLERETYLKTLAPQMISGPLQGQLLRMISLMLKPQRILEIGTFTGYAALCMAEGLADGGKLFTVEANRELEWIIRKYISLAGVTDQIQLHIGDAKSWLPDLSESFELVFIDAGKMDYALYYDLIIDKVAPGGIILVDNVLWSGKVVEAVTDADTINMKAFNDKIHLDDRVDNLILPLRDGLMMIRKKD